MKPGRAGDEALPAVVALLPGAERERDRAVRLRHRARREVARVLRVVRDRRDRARGRRAPARRTCATAGPAASTRAACRRRAPCRRALSAGRATGCAVRSRRRSCRSSRGPSRAPEACRRSSAPTAPRCSRTRYETQSGCGASAGPTAATVCSVRLTVGAPPRPGPAAERAPCSRRGSPRCRSRSGSRPRRRPRRPRGSWLRCRSRRVYIEPRAATAAQMTELSSAGHLQVILESVRFQGAAG